MTVDRADMTGPAGPEPGDDSPGTDGWAAFLAPAVLAFGVLALVVAVPGVLVAWLAPFGDCQDAACESDRIWSEVRSSQETLLLGWPIVALVIGWLARDHPRLWIALALLSATIAFVGLASAVGGLGSDHPSILGYPIPVVSPGFAFWLPAAILLSVGGMLSWIGATRSRS